MAARTLLFTFDHELFLGRKSGTIDRCMIEPATQVLRILEAHGLRAVFFVDSTYLMRLREVALEHARARADLERLSDHLADLVRRGHWVYPHIHSHWIDARYDPATNEWDLSELRHYRFSELTAEDKAHIFDGCLQVLGEIVRQADPSYALDAYRAGGWCIQPFSDFKPFFQRHGIRYDLSVLAGMRKRTNAVRYDFTGPLPGPVYRFSEDVMRPEAKGEFVELAISCIEPPHTRLLDKLTEKVLWHLPHGRQLGDGTGVQFVDQDDAAAPSPRREMISIELLTWTRVGRYLDHVAQNDLTQFISHPKMLSPYNLAMLDGMLRKLGKRYELNSNWKRLAGAPVRAAGPALRAEAGR